MTSRSIETVHSSLPSKMEKHLPAMSVIENDSLYYDPFLLFDHFKQGEAFGATDHPHRGLQLILYIVDGHVLHDDTFTSRAPIDLGPGSLLHVQSGSGIVHYEIPSSTLETETVLQCFQIWINTTKEAKFADPVIREFASEDVPIVRTEDKLAEIRVIAGSVFGVAGLLETDPRITLLDISLDMAYGNLLCLDVLDDDLETAFVYVFSPTSSECSKNLISIGDKLLKAGEIGVLANSGNKVEIKLLSEPCRILLVAGKPLREPVVQDGPFAMSKRSEIEQAYADYQDGKFGSLLGMDERKKANEEAFQRYIARKNTPDST